MEAFLYTCLVVLLVLWVYNFIGVLKCKRNLDRLAKEREILIKELIELQSKR